MVRPLTTNSLPKTQARLRRDRDGGVLKDAFIAALRDRVARDPSGTITLPVGRVDVAEVARVLVALDRARHTGGR